MVAAMSELSAQYPRLRLPADPRLPGPRGHRDELGSRAIGCGGRPGCRCRGKRPRRRIASGRPRPLPPTGANQVWCYDFVFDACANGQQLKCLTVIDEYTREGLAIDVDGGIRSGRVIEVLSSWSACTARRGTCAPTTGRSSCRARSCVDHQRQHRDGVDRSGQALAEWRRRELQRQVPRRVPGLEWFRNRIDAKIVIETWRRRYNEVRPHSSLGYLTPVEFKQSLSTTNPEEPSSREQWSEESRQVTVTRPSILHAGRRNDPMSLRRATTPRRREYLDGKNRKSKRSLLSIAGCQPLRGPPQNTIRLDTNTVQYFRNLSAQRLPAVVSGKASPAPPVRRGRAACRPIHRKLNGATMNRPRAGNQPAI